MLPMFIAFSFDAGTGFPKILSCFHMVVIGLLMISRIPTWSPKLVRISRENVKYFLVACAFAGAAVLTYAWTTLVVLCLSYVVLVLWGLIKKTPE
jgi:CDP-diacylglycerol--serine O-phosphatidyltransferase